MAERRDASETGAIARPRPLHPNGGTWPTVAVAVALAVVSLGVTGCGGGDSPGQQLADRPAPRASEFPSARGKTLSQLLASSGAQRSGLVVSPSSPVYEPGENRFAFGVFTVSREQVTDAPVAIYAAPSGGGKAVGPFPARIESLAVKPQFESQTTATDPDAAKVLYVTDLNFDSEGNWDLVALFREGNGYTAALIPTIQVGGFEGVPAVGERAPRIHTPTISDVGGDLGQIDTRSPHDDMHAVDFADVHGKKPVVLLFATPALCVSRVCGPVVDIAEQVEHETGDGVDFIHMEVYKNNNALDGYRPQLRSFGLKSEPWLFVIDRNGIVSTRISGAFDVPELEAAVRKVAG